MWKTVTAVQVILWVWTVNGTVESETPPWSLFDQTDGCKARFLPLSDDESIVLRYKVTAPTEHPHLGSIQVELTSEHGGWLGFGVASEQETLEDAVVAIGRPHGTVSKFSLPGAKLMHRDQQTLMEKDIYEDDVTGRTVLTFTKMLEEPSETPINGFQWMLWAVGDTKDIPSFSTPDVWHSVLLDVRPCLTKSTGTTTVSSTVTTQTELIKPQCKEEPYSLWRYKNGTMKSCQYLHWVKESHGVRVVGPVCQNPNFTAKSVCCHTCAIF